MRFIPLSRVGSFMSESHDNNPQTSEPIIIERRRRDEHHERHHRWVQEQIESERERRRMYATITKVAIQWSIPVVFGSILYWVKSHFTL